MAGADDALVVQNEADAWVYLEEVLSGTLRIDPDSLIKFDGWPIISITIYDGDSSITPSVMEGFVSLQKSILRSYCLVKYQTDDLRRLTNEEKRALEFKVVVNKGSSHYSLDLQKIAEDFVIGAIDKMEPVHIVITILGIAVLLAGTTAFRFYLNSRVEERRLEVQAKDKRDLLDHLSYLSQQDIERTKVLARALREQAELLIVKEHSDDAKNELLKSIGTTSGAKIENVDVPGPVASELRRASRRSSEEITFFGIYSILRVDTTGPDGFRVRLFNIESGEEFTATVGDAVRFQRQRSDLQKAEWSRSKIQCTIEAKKLGDEITNGKIIETKIIDQD